MKANRGLVDAVASLKGWFCKHTLPPHKAQSLRVVKFGRSSVSTVTILQRLVRAVRGSSSAVSVPQRLVTVSRDSASTVSAPQMLVKAGRGLVGVVSVLQKLVKGIRGSAVKFGSHKGL